MCWARATTEWASRTLSKKHAKDAEDESGLRYLDGRWLWVSEQPPAEGDDEFA